MAEDDTDMTPEEFRCEEEGAIPAAVFNLGGQDEFSSWLADLHRQATDQGLSMEYIAAGGLATMNPYHDLVRNTGSSNYTLWVRPL